MRLRSWYMTQGWYMRRGVFLTGYMTSVIHGKGAVWQISSSRVIGSFCIGLKQIQPTFIQEEMTITLTIIINKHYSTQNQNLSTAALVAFVSIIMENHFWLAMWKNDLQFCKKRFPPLLFWQVDTNCKTKHICIWKFVVAEINWSM